MKILFLLLTFPFLICAEEIKSDEITYPEPVCYKKSTCINKLTDCKMGQESIDGNYVDGSFKYLVRATEQYSCIAYNGVETQIEQEFISDETFSYYVNIAGLEDIEQVVQKERERKLEACNLERTEWLDIFEYCE